MVACNFFCGVPSANEVQGSREIQCNDVIVEEHLGARRWCWTVDSFNFSQRLHRKNDVCWLYPIGAQWVTPNWSCTVTLHYRKQFWYPPTTGIRKGLCRQEFFCEISLQYTEIFRAIVYSWGPTALIAPSFSQDMQTLVGFSSRRK